MASGDRRSKVRRTGQGGGIDVARGDDSDHRGEDRQAEECFDWAGDWWDLAARHCRAIVGALGTVISDSFMAIFHSRGAHTIASAIGARTRSPASQQRSQHEDGKKRAEQTNHDPFYQRETKA
ncbi:hypothetical protein IY145_03515 [Methylosinus sp. H3A]|uniref:hypothetical protein n=1 Tax=unclassified Methylosinus TaxID=2624500 RepID=UPI0004653182|nr:MULTISPECIES: hypothetical protein [unclassified Methylosinus]MBG0808435.1 hypothetical protein [Methylosinus sp. H3A]